MAQVHGQFIRINQSDCQSGRPQPKCGNCNSFYKQLLSRRAERYIHAQQRTKHIPRRLPSGNRCCRVAPRLQQLVDTHIQVHHSRGSHRNAYSHGDAYRNGNPHVYSHGDAYIDGNSHANSDAYTDGNAHPNEYFRIRRNRHPHLHADGDAYPYGNAHPNPFAAPARANR